MVKILREFKSNIVHIDLHVCWKYHLCKMTSQNVLNAKARLGGDQNQVVTVVLSIFHFVEFPTDMFDMYYIPLEFPRNLHHQVSF